MPLWRAETRAARTRGARIESEFRGLASDFAENQRRVITATERAEAAAVALIRGADEIARAVARRGK
jgi:hypothetical protein